LEKFPLKTSNFSIFFSLGQKKSLRVRSESTQVEGGSASYLLRVKSKLGLGPISNLDEYWTPNLRSHFKLKLCQKMPFWRTEILYSNCFEAQSLIFSTKISKNHMAWVKKISRRGSDKDVKMAICYMIHCLLTI